MIKLHRPPLPPEIKSKHYEEEKKKRLKKERERIGKYAGELIEVLQGVSKDKKLFINFLKDILTPKEYKMLSMRWQIVKQLAKGISQRQIAENLGVSIATITRGSRELLDKAGGFHYVLDKYYAKK